MISFIRYKENESFGMLIDEFQISRGRGEEAFGL